MDGECTGRAQPGGRNVRGSFGIDKNVIYVLLLGMVMLPEGYTSGDPPLFREVHRA